MAPMKKRIFISYNSDDRKAATALRDKLANRFDCYIDYEASTPGNYWRPKLQLSLAQSHAGLLVLTPRALGSSWVRTEATVMCYRREVDRHFHLFVTPDPDVTDPELAAAGWDPLRLTDIQWLPSGDPEVVEKEIVQVLDRQPDRTLFDKIASRLAKNLETVDSDTLADLLDTCGRQTAVWPYAAPGDQPYAIQLARCLLDDEHLGQYPVSELLNQIRHTVHPQNMKNVLELIAPLWVDGKAAGPLPWLSRHAAPRIAVLNAARPGFTPRMYVNRAHLLDQFEYLPVPTASAGDNVTHITEQICEAVGVRHPYLRGKSAEHVIRELNTWTEPVYVCLQLLLPPSDLVELRQLFPNVTFIVCPGSSATFPDSLTLTAPDPEVEKEQIEDYEGACRALHRAAVSI